MVAGGGMGGGRGGGVHQSVPSAIEQQGCGLDAAREGPVESGAASTAGDRKTSVSSPCHGSSGGCGERERPEARTERDTQAHTCTHTRPEQPSQRGPSHEQACGGGQAVGGNTSHCAAQTFGLDLGTALTPEQVRESARAKGGG